MSAVEGEAADDAAEDLFGLDIGFYSALNSIATAHVTDSLAASYFDSVTAKAQAARLRLVAVDLILTGEGFERCVCATDVPWPERNRHGLRVEHFSDGGFVQCADAAVWDA